MNITPTMGTLSPRFIDPKNDHGLHSWWSNAIDRIEAQEVADECTDCDRCNSIIKLMRQMAFGMKSFDNKVNDVIYASLEDAEDGKAPSSQTERNEIAMLESILFHGPITRH